MAVPGTGNKFKGQSFICSVRCVNRYRVTLKPCFSNYPSLFLYEGDVERMSLFPTTIAYVGGDYSVLNNELSINIYRASNLACSIFSSHLINWHKLCYRELVLRCKF